MGLLAHQGGWDETLLVLAPLVVIALVLKAANRRAKAAAAAAQVSGTVADLGVTIDESAHGRSTDNESH